MADHNLFRPNGKINRAAAFIHMLGGAVPHADQSFIELFDACDHALKKQRPTVSNGALSNTHGAWYEWLLGIAAWNFHAANPTSFVALPLPNVNRFKVDSLYIKELHDYIEGLRLKVAESAHVQLITSNPDFVIIDTKHLSLPPDMEKPITEVSFASLQALEQQYKNFIGLCGFTDIKGYAAVKRSLRPDRRLQIPHEASLMKALYRHMQTRLWIPNPPGIKYYALTSKFSKKDTEALQTVATHSITTVLNTPERAVDDLLPVNSGKDAIKAFQTMLSPAPSKVEG